MYFEQKILGIISTRESSQSWPACEQTEVSGWLLLEVEFKLEVFKKKLDSPLLRSSGFLAFRKSIRPLLAL